MTKLILMLFALGLLLGGCVGSPDQVYEVRKEDTGAAGQHETRFAETVHQAHSELGVTLDVRSPDGSPVRVGCVTCHQMVEPEERNRFATEIGGFHGPIELAHGDLTCRSCHNEPRFEDFRLSSGRVVAYAQVIDLCAQCHGDKLKDYLHGAHGGMTGFWDLDKGPRMRNHCLDCHHAHKPQFPAMMPVAPPIYREQQSPAGTGEAHHE